MTHTPGPWHVHEVNSGVAKPSFSVGSDDWAVCNTGMAADARLIASAPELLEACKIALANCSPAYSSEHLVIKTLNAAIAKAEGSKDA